MRDQTEVGGGILVAEGRDGRGHSHEAGDGGARFFREFPVLAQGNVFPIFHQPHVDVHAGTGFAGGDLGGEAHIQPVAVRQVADDPFGQQKLVCSGFQRAGEELDFVLFVHFAVQGEVAHFAVAVFDLAAGFGYMVHAFAAEVVQFGERLALMVALLVRGGEQFVFLTDNVVFQLAHGLELQAGGLFEGFFRAHERCVRRAVEGLAVLVEEAAEEAEGGYLVERIYEGGPVAGNHVEVTVAGLDEGGEQAGTVYALTFREDGFCIGQAVYGKIEGFHAAVFGRIHEINHPDAFFADEMQHVFAGEILRHLFQERHHFVGVEFNVFVHVCVVEGTKIPILPRFVNTPASLPPYRCPPSGRVCCHRPTLWTHDSILGRFCCHRPILWTHDSTGCFIHAKSVSLKK